MALLCASLAALATFTVAPSARAADAAETCPNAQLRAENSSLALPDCRAYELVSPVQKNGGAVQGLGAIFGGGVLQAAVSGEAATFSSSASFGAASQGAPPASQYIARRTQAGWSTENITQPTLSGAYGEAPDGVPYRLFSPDLARGLLLNGARCAAAEPCPHSYSLRDDESGTLATSPQEPDLRFAGASPDLRHVVLSTCAALTPNATEVPGTEGCDPAKPNLYEWGEGRLTLLNVSPGAELAAQGAAVSADGSRLYFTEAGKLWLRAGSAIMQVDEAQGGGGQFQTATPDGSLAFFTKAGHLSRYAAEEGLLSAIDLTPSGGVVGVLGISEDGSSVYFQDVSGLQRWSEGTITQIAAGPQAAQPSDWPPSAGTARVSADGETLLFLSEAQLTGYDNTDQATGEPDSEVFLYRAGSGGGGSLTCLSCNLTAEPPLGPSTIPGAIANGSTVVYKPRDLSSDGTRVFFDSYDSILPTDASAASDVYEWEAQGTGTCQQPGDCLSLISAASGPEASSFIDASTDGRDVFFLTGDSLVPTDPGSIDLYDAREAGGFPVPKPPIACEGDACQSVPSPPEDPTPGTLVPGLPNPPVHFPKTTQHKKAHHKHKKRHHKKSHRATNRGGGRR